MNESIKKIILVGSGGFVSEIIQYLNDIKNSSRKVKSNSSIEIFGIVDNYNEDNTLNQIDGINFLGKEEDLKSSEEYYFLIANGNPKYRKAAYDRLKKNERKLFTLIHPTAYLASNCTIGEGTIICPNTIVNSNTDIGDASLINVFSSIGHHSRVGKFTVLSPFCSLSGYSKIGDSCFLGSRATLFPKISIGSNCTIDSHTYVKSNVESYTMVSLRSEYLSIKNRLR